MARTDNLTNFLTDVATAIKTKKGDEAPILASNFDTEIANLPSGGGEIDDYFISPFSSSVIASIKKLPNLEFNGTIMSSLFDGFTNLEEITIKITSQPTNLQRAFNNCKKIVSVPYFDTSKCTTFYGTFYGCSKLKNIPHYDTGQSTTFYDCFRDCVVLEEIPELNFENATTIYQAFYNCYELKNVPNMNTTKCTNLSRVFFYTSTTKLVSVGEIDGSSATSVAQMFSFRSTPTYFTTFGGVKDLGKAYLTTSNANYANYSLNLNQATNLTEQSLINILTKVYDIASLGVKTQSIILGATNLAKLTSEAGQQALANAQTKGWTIS